jgi:DNA-binding response OmpR family regulator
MLPKIMIVDDEPDLCRALGDFLDDFEAFDIRTAGSAEEALQALEKASADVCVVDLRLPGMNGIELVKVLAERNLCRKHILHTASLDFELGSDLRALGFTEDDILFKPVDNLVVFERIGTLLEKLQEEDGRV